MADLPRLDVLAIGNAIVDVLAHAEDGFLAAEGLVKGSMRLIDDETAVGLYERMGPAIEASGGGAANTAAGVASFGGQSGFIGKVRDDQFGQLFTHDIRAAGVHFDTLPATSGEATARSLILVTPDAERTMNTYLGVAAEVGEVDVTEELVASAAVTFVEGFLCGIPVTEAALQKAVALAGRVALTLSDAMWLDAQRDTFMQLLGKTDVLFANTNEAKMLFQTDDFEAACSKLADTVPLAAVTRSELGSIVLADGERFEVPAEPVERVVDTTGAGDLYAAGFLFGLSRGLHPAECARYGSIAAAEIISHVGARPEVPLKTLLESGRAR